MKTVIIFLSLFVMSSSCIAQTVSLALVSSPSASTFVDLKAQHNKLALEQISAHIQGHIQYPDLYLDEGFDGKGIIEISISKKGAIQRSKFRENTLPNSIEEAARKALESFSQVDTKGAKYMGAKKIHIPLHFRIQ